MVGRVLAELGHEAAGPAFALFDAWASALGEDAAHAEPVDLRGGVLLVSVRSPVWSQQLQMRRTEILASLRAELGEAAPSELRFRVDPDPSGRVG
jgi:predicted nucleic acid-binding Zn ribbon protein